MEIDSKKNERNSSGSAHLVMENIRAKAEEKDALIAKNRKAGEPLFETIRTRYHNELNAAIQGHMATFEPDIVAKFGDEDLWEQYDTIYEHLRSTHCRYCGSDKQYSAEKYGAVAWLGIGETENCQCGAAYEHWHPQYKMPLSERSISQLLWLAKEVEHAYGVAGSPMSYEQIAQNRNYLGRILDAIVNAERNHIPGRFKHDLDVAQYNERYHHMLELMDKVDGAGTARFFIKYGDRVQMDELNGMIAELELELTAKTLLSNSTS
jgi:hypothetical protein